MRDFHCLCNYRTSSSPVFRQTNPLPTPTSKKKAKQTKENNKNKETNKNKKRKLQKLIVLGNSQLNQFVFYSMLILNKVSSFSLYKGDKKSLQIICKI